MAGVPLLSRIVFYDNSGNPLANGFIRLFPAGSSQNMVSEINLDANGVATGLTITQNVDIHVFAQGGTGSLYVIEDVREALDRASVNAGSQTILDSSQVFLGSDQQNFLTADPTFAADGTATNAAHAVPIGFADGRYARIDGDMSQAFTVANVAVDDDGALALNKGSADTIFAAINGNANETFEVADATEDEHAVNLRVGNERYAALTGSASIAFEVADATQNSHALNRRTADGRYHPINGLGDGLPLELSVSNTSTPASTEALSIGTADTRYVPLTTTEYYTRQQADGRYLPSGSAALLDALRALEA